jgi:hypothetical protein
MAASPGHLVRAKRRLERRSEGQQAPMRPERSADGKQLAAVLRINALWRLHCCALPVFCWAGAGAPGKSKISTPVPSAPGNPELREASLASIAVGASTPCRTSDSPPYVAASFAGEARASGQGRQREASAYSRRTGNSSPRCFASKPCGTCIVAGCPFSVGEEWELRPT